MIKILQAIEQGVDKDQLADDAKPTPPKSRYFDEEVSRSKIVESMNQSLKPPGEPLIQLRLEHKTLACDNAR